MGDVKTKDIVDAAFNFLIQRFATQRRMETKPNSGGKLRSFSGETVEALTCLIWNALAKQYNVPANIETGSEKPIIITDAYGNSIEKKCRRNPIDFR